MNPQSKDTRPLVSLILLTYNQQQYVRESVRAALTQTYSPLEIIISDDCSSDSTYEIAQECCRAYDGPHKVVLNRNGENLGIGAHIHKLHTSSQGEWIVHAAGDDLSVAYRVESLLHAVLDAECRPALVVSNAERIDENGAVFGTLQDPNKPIAFTRSGNPFDTTIPMLGCTVAVHRSLVDDFPPILPGIMAEDVVLYRRALMHGGVMYVPEKLVMYRAHRGSVSQRGGRDRSEYIRWQTRWSNDRLLRLEQLRLDLLHAKPPDHTALLSTIERHRASERRTLRILGDNFGQATVAIMAEMIGARGTLPIVKQRVKDFLIRWAPWLLGYN